MMNMTKGGRATPKTWAEYVGFTGDFGTYVCVCVCIDWHNVNDAIFWIPSTKIPSWRFFFGVGKKTSMKSDWILQKSFWNSEILGNLEPCWVPSRGWCFCWSINSTTFFLLQYWMFFCLRTLVWICWLLGIAKVINLIAHIPKSCYKTSRVTQSWNTLRIQICPKISGLLYIPIGAFGDGMFRPSFLF